MNAFFYPFTLSLIGVVAWFLAPAQQAKLTGEISGLPDSVEVLELHIDSYALLSSLEKVDLPIDSSGKFAVMLDLRAPARLFISLGKTPVLEQFEIQTSDGRDSAMRVSTNDPRLIYFYLNPGQRQHVEVEASHIKETLKFTGDGANNSFYINEDAWKFDTYKDRYLKNFYLNTNFLPDAFKEVVDTRVGERMQFLETFHQQHPLSEHLHGVYRRDILLEGVTAKIFYPSRRQTYLKLASVSLPESYYDFLDSVNFQDTSANKGIAYFYFLDGYLRKMHELQSDQVAFHDYVDRRLDGRLYYEYAAFKLGSDFRPEWYDLFNKKTLFPDLTAAVKAKYAHLEGMLPGRKAPKLRLTNENRQQTSLGKFRGKYVYIDLWATWCGPCIQEIPHLQQLEKDYEGQNIVFLSLSMDNAKAFDKWKAFLVDYPLRGHQYWLAEEENAKISQQFNVRQIPRFILLDPKLKVVDANAPRPSSAEIRHLLDRVL